MKKEIIKNTLLLLCGFSCCLCLDSFGMEQQQTQAQRIEKYDRYFQAMKNKEFTKEQQINNNLNIVRLLESQLPFLIANLVEEDTNLYKRKIFQWINKDPSLQGMPDFQTFQRKYEDKADLFQLAFFIKSNACPEEQDFKFLSEHMDSGYLLALARVALAIGRSINFVQNDLNCQVRLSALGTCALRAYQLNMKNILWINPENNFERQAIIRNAGRIVFDFFGFTESEFIIDSSDDMLQIEASEKKLFSKEDTKYEEKTTEDPTIILLNHLLDHVHIWLGSKDWSNDDFKMYCLHKNGDRRKNANSAVIVSKEMLPITNWYTQTLSTLYNERKNIITRTRNTHEAVYFLIPFTEFHKYTRPEWTSVSHEYSSYMVFGINRDGILKTMFPGNSLK